MQAGTFVESFQRKMSDLMGRWQREGKLIVFGRARVDSNRLSPECREEMFSVMAESLQKHVVAAANAQIKSTKNLLSLPNAIGLLGVTTPNVKNCPLAFMAAVRTRVLPANLPKMWAGSTGRCNTGLQFTRRGFKAQGLSRALI